MHNKFTMQKAIMASDTAHQVGFAGFKKKFRL